MKSLRVKLVYPGRPGGSVTQDTWISHGLCFLSACAKAAGHETGLIDLRTVRSPKHLAASLRRERPDVVAITALSVHYDDAMAVAKIAKEACPSTLTVVGGPHASIMPEECLGNPYVDVVLRGEGEISFVEILDNLARGGLPQGLVEGKRPDLDRLPLPDRDLFPRLEEPVPGTGLEAPFVTVISSRGCMYNCRFCQPAERLIFGRRVRRRSVVNVIAELKALRERYAFRGLLIHDDCLTEDPDWVEEFCRRYRAEGFDAAFACQTRADIVCRDPGLFGTMKDAGLVTTIVGFESGSDRVLKFLRKGTTVRQNIEAAGILRRQGIRVWANYMLGIPTETKQEVLATVRMIKAIRPETHSAAYFTPHPGSDLFDYCEREGISLIRKHSDYQRNLHSPKIKGVDYDFLEWALYQSKDPSPHIPPYLPLPRTAFDRALRLAVRTYREGGAALVARKSLGRIARGSRKVLSRVRPFS